MVVPALVEVFGADVDDVGVVEPEGCGVPGAVGGLGADRALVKELVEVDVGGGRAVADDVGGVNVRAVDRREPLDRGVDVHGGGGVDDAGRGDPDKVFGAGEFVDDLPAGVGAPVAVGVGPEALVDGIEGVELIPIDIAVGVPLVELTHVQAVDLPLLDAEEGGVEFVAQVEERGVRVGCVEGPAGVGAVEEVGAGIAAAEVGRLLSEEEAREVGEAAVLADPGGVAVPVGVGRPAIGAAEIRDLRPGVPETAIAAEGLGSAGVVVLDGLGGGEPGVVGGGGLEALDAGVVAETRLGADGVGVRVVSVRDVSKGVGRGVGGASVVKEVDLVDGGEVPVLPVLEHAGPDGDVAGGRPDALNVVGRHGARGGVGDDLVAEEVGGEEGLDARDDLLGLALEVGALGGSGGGDAVEVGAGDVGGAEEREDREDGEGEDQDAASARGGVRVGVEAVGHG